MKNEEKIREIEVKNVSENFVVSSLFDSIVNLENRGVKRGKVFSSTEQWNRRERKRVDCVKHLFEHLTCF